MCKICVNTGWHHQKDTNMNGFNRHRNERDFKVMYVYETAKLNEDLQEYICTIYINKIHLF
jgi:hypothetical protein